MKVSTDKPGKIYSAAFHVVCPAFVRLHFVYPVMEKLRAVAGVVTEKAEPITLFFQTCRARLTLRNPSLVKKALGDISPEWVERIRDVTSCPDNAHIPRCPNAGKIDGSVIAMHNGIRVRALGYYGSGILNMLVRNRGVHEPQEERAFAAVLPHIAPGSTILELGAYWGFYSLWFASEISGAKCFLVEPDPRNLEAGRQNFKLNGFRATFTRAAVGSVATTGIKSASTVSVDGFCEYHRIDRLQILHSDIQGSELLMLQGAKKMIAAKAIDYIFISTHGDVCHYGCLKVLQEAGYAILCSVDNKQSYSFDGIIVARCPAVTDPPTLDISVKRTLIRN